MTPRPNETRTIQDAENEADVSRQVGACGPMIVQELTLPSRLLSLGMMRAGDPFRLPPT